MNTSNQRGGNSWSKGQNGVGGQGTQSVRCTCNEVRARRSKPWPVSMFEEKVDVIGVPIHTGQDKEGVARGPKRLREHGVLNSLRDMGFQINDKGDISVSDVEGDQSVHNVKHPKTLGLINQMLQQKVAQSLRSGSSVLALGGDHSLAVGSILGQAAATPDFGVIYVDAHADLNPPLSSISGHSHGMPLAFLIHELKEFIPKQLPHCDWIRPCLHAKDVIHIALRDVDPAEKFIIDKYKMTAYSMHDVVKYGIDRVAQRAVEAASHRNTRPIHLSFDIDALDPSEAPSTGTPVAGGLTMREGIHIVETAAATGLLKVLDMTEVNPELLDEKDQRKTLDAAGQLIKSWFGHRSLKLIHPSFQLTKPHNSFCNPIIR